MQTIRPASGASSSRSPGSAARSPARGGRGGRPPSAVVSSVTMTRQEVDGALDRLFAGGWCQEEPPAGPRVLGGLGLHWQAPGSWEAGGQGALAGPRHEGLPGGSWPLVITTTCAPNIRRLGPRHTAQHTRCRLSWLGGALCLATTVPQCKTLGMGCHQQGGRARRVQRRQHFPLTAGVPCVLCAGADLVARQGPGPLMDPHEEVQSGLYVHQKEALAWMVKVTVNPPPASARPTACLLQPAPPRAPPPQESARPCGPPLPHSCISRRWRRAGCMLLSAQRTLHDRH